MELLIIFIVNASLVGLGVLIHYETLSELARRLPRFHVRPRARVLAGVLGILAAHVVEIWLFALGYWTLLHVPGMGHLSGNIEGPSLLECSYFSFVTFTTVGYGDIVASGYLRYLTGLEALTGMVLITWSASFLFLEMQRYWLGPQRSDRGHERAREPGDHHPAD